MKRQKKTIHEQSEKLTFRLSPRYAEKVFRVSKAAGITPNQFGRVATMAMAENRFLELAEKMERMEGELSSLRQDFNDAVQDDD